MDNYNKKYNELLIEYKQLEAEYKKLNNQLFILTNSRSYKLSKLISKIYKPIRNAKNLLTKKNIYIKKIQKFVNSNQKLVIIPCSFEFDEYVNQRPINFAKYFSNKGYNVLYIVWQWDKYTKVNNSYMNVYKNVFQIPLYDFLESNISYDNLAEKLFCINFPNEVFLDLAYTLRSDGFYVYYDIMDEWEEFQKVGQSDWYNKNVEESLIMTADLVSAVSPYLVDKFNDIRHDILLSRNGFYMELTGLKSKNISLKSINNNKINIGYFGHLTDSWFDWNMIIDLAKNNNNYIFHIIGYGIPEKIEKEISNINNIICYGKIPTSQLFNYVKDWNIGMIPFIESDLAKAVDPIKIYEYLYMGLPVIVSGIESVKNYPKTYYINSQDEFKQSIELIVKNINNMENIDKFLDESTWNARFEIILKAYKREGINILYEK